MLHVIAVVVYTRSTADRERQSVSSSSHRSPPPQTRRGAGRERLLLLGDEVPGGGLGLKTPRRAQLERGLSLLQVSVLLPGVPHEVCAVFHHGLNPLHTARDLVP